MNAPGAATPATPATPRVGSLRRKFLLVVMSATAAALLLSAIALLLYEVRSYKKSWAEDMQSQAELMAQLVAPALLFDDAKAAQHTLASLRLRSQIRHAAVFDANGVLFAEYRAGDASSAAASAPAMPGTARTSAGQIEVVRDIRRDDDLVGSVYLRARHDLLGRSIDYAAILALTSAAGLALAWLIFSRLHPAITAPILAVADVSRRVVNERNYDQRVSVTSDDEVGVLVHAFNNMLRDLSDEMRERHAAEDALRAADRRKDEFLATLAHELRNPLAPLANALAVLKRADHNASMRGTSLAMMERQLAQMVRLIDDLMEVSRITRGTLALKLDTTDVVIVALAAMEAAEPALHHHRVRTQLPAAAAWVLGDAARLTQVLVNLLHNAAKYTPRGGHITLSVVSGDSVQVVVQDDGMGIAPEHLQRVFEMFTQLDTTPVHGTAGLGVGLTIARQIVELHGGSLAVHSDGPGRGTRFTVTLVAHAAPPLLAPAMPGFQHHPHHGSRPA